MSATCTYCSGTIVDEVCEDCGRAAKKHSLVSVASGGLDSPDTVTAPTTSTARTHSSTRFTVNYPSRATTPGSTKPTRRRTSHTTHTSTRRNALGGGLISLPELPSQDPLNLLMASPEVPAHKRHCPKCDNLVNRSKGFCPQCGTAYNFEPHLKTGDLVAGKYEIKGPIAFGGLGWIYLGWDQVLTRWVVLKGLLNANDASSAAAAVAERRYLAAVKHAKIVGIYDFVQQGAEGFIIMEYVGGVTVHALRKKAGPLPVTEAIAYILGVLPAFSYLHGQGLVYCDFKPDNIMVEAGDVKLIDMGAVRKIGDPNGDIYATVGFAAPEADADPLAVSDLYTLGRALAVLIMDFKFSSQYVHSLPTPDEQAVLADHESLYRFLLRATHVDPDERFQTADEMFDQLFGVLREIVALDTGPKPIDSKIFGGDAMLQAGVADILGGPAARLLPALRVNLDDRSAKEVVRVLSLMNVRQQYDELQMLVDRYGERAIEPRLRLVELITLHPELSGEGRYAKCHTLLTKIEVDDPYDWRAAWFRGMTLLDKNNGRDAMACFERVYFEMPGELAPRLAMGIAAETAGLLDQALAYYDRVGRVDPAYVSAHAGAARCHAVAGNLPAAIEALQRTPANHTLYNTFQLVIGELLLAQGNVFDLALIQAAESAVHKALPESTAAHQLAGRLYETAIALLKRIRWPAGSPFLESSFQENALREGAEAQYRQAAQHAAGEAERIHWVTQANRARPLTLF